MQAKTASWTGSVNLAMPVSLSFGVLASLTIIVTILAWLWLGHYTRRERVSGALVPTAGLIDVSVRDKGVITEVLVREGTVIREGQALVVLSGERSSRALGDTAAGISQLLRTQRSRLEADIDNSQMLLAEQVQGLHSERDLLSQQIVQVDGQLGIATRQRTNLALILEKIKPLLRQGYISVLQVQQQELQLVETENQLKALLRQRLDLEQRKDAANRQMRQVPLATQAKVNDLRRQMAQAEQALAQNEAERATVLRAPRAGTVSSLVARAGQSVSTGDVLMAILPKQSLLQAQLLVPSRAAGFVKPGMTVALHYQAFPYQKFGVEKGIVAQISRSALPPTEISALLNKPMAADESMYRVIVRLHRQHITAYGKSEPLRPGMVLDADIQLDRRRLVEWLFEPLYGMRARIKDSTE